MRSAGILPVFLISVLNMDSRIVNKRSLEGLVLSGAFDSCGQAGQHCLMQWKLRLTGGIKCITQSYPQPTAFSEVQRRRIKISEPVLPEVKPWTSEYRLAKEREVLGFYVTGHPLSKYEFDYWNFASIHLGETEELENYDDVVKACGVVTALKTKIDKAGKDNGIFYTG